eukprot:scaffold425_cov175-Amphora_coffeaeformis.AAC.40
MSAQDIPMVVVFGRPGAGKTVVADSAVETVLQKQRMSRSVDSTLRPIGLDLDVCVPQWMRDNFAKGLYPTLEERIAFAEAASDHVEDSLEKTTAVLPEGHVLGAIVSFSFVNADLRDTFRKRFPKAKWFLVDTSEDEAAERIRRREGHFYKGKVEPVTKDEVESRPKSDNEEWNFAPVSFQHTVLNGIEPIEHNAGIVADGLMEIVIQTQ